MPYDNAVSANTVLGMIRRTFTDLDLKLPATLTKELAALDGQVAHSADALPRFDPGTLAAAVVTCIATGKDPATDENIRTLLARRQLASIDMWATIEARQEQQRAAVLRKHAASVIELTKPAVERADDALHESREQFPGMDLRDARFATGRPAQQLVAWGRAREAVDQLTKLMQMWRMVTNTLGLARVDPRTQPLVLADLSLEQLDDACRKARGPDPLAAVYAGYRLSLATPDAYAARHARLEKERAEAQSQQRVQGMATARLA